MVSLPFVIWALLTKFSFFSFFMVEGPSMEPFLHDGDIFLLDQHTYGNSEPGRGDIVVFSLYDKPDYYYVKRVVGLPGEKLTVDDSGVYLHFAGGGEQKLEEGYLLSKKNTEERPVTVKKPAAKDLFIVPPGDYFVLGDNRSHSLDSRYFSGHYIKKDRILGKYLLTIYDR